MQYTKTGLSILATMALTLTGCGGGSSSSSSDGGTPSSAPDTATYTTVDASSTSAWAHMDFSSGSSNATVNDIWQVGFQRYNGMSNSGISATGSGPNADDVSVCVAYKFDGLYDGDGNPVLSEFEKLNLNNTLEAFNSVTKASCASGDYLTDTLSTQIKSDDWMEASTPYPTISYQAETTDNNGWIIQSADGNSYARVKVSDVDITYNGATDHSISPARIKLSSEKWNGTSWDAALDSGWLDFEAGAVYWDLETNTTVTQADQWDLNVQLPAVIFRFVLMAVRPVMVTAVSVWSLPVTVMRRMSQIRRPLATARPVKSVLTMAMVFPVPLPRWIRTTGSLPIMEPITRCIRTLRFTW